MRTEVEPVRSKPSSTATKKSDPVQSPALTTLSTSPASPASSSRLSAHNWRAHWLTAVEFSRVTGRPLHTIYTWLRNGTLAEFGIPVYQTRHGGLHSARVFIKNVF
jgi:hypothetical protein